MHCGTGLVGIQPFPEAWPFAAPLSRYTYPVMLVRAPRTRYMHHPRAWTIPAYLHYPGPLTPSITSPPRQEAVHRAAREIDMPLAPVVGYRQRDIHPTRRAEAEVSPLNRSPAWNSPAREIEKRAAGRGFAVPGIL